MYLLTCANFWGVAYMAEYYISYKEMCDIIEDYISTAEQHDLLEQYKIEILAALTGDFGKGDLDSVQEMISLWENQEKKPSQLLLGTRYIRVQQSMIDFLKAILTSGVVDALIEYTTQGSFAGFTVSAGTSVAIALWDLLNNVKTLGDWDFCVYMQAATHFKAHKDFTFDDLKSWMPTSEHPICNMHNGTWDCDYWLEEDDTCTIQNDQKLTNAVDSLCNKGLLSKRKEDHKYIFKFKR